MDKEIKNNSEEARSIVISTIEGSDDFYKKIDEETKNNLISHTREDVAFAALNTVSIYKYMKSSLGNAALCRVFIIILLLYSAIKVS